MDINAPVRVCPAFKIYWVENGKIVSIKRYDHNQPYIIPQEIFHLVRRVYQNFNFEEHCVKFKDEDGELVDLTVTDNISFQFDKTFTQFHIYVFTSKEDAANFTLPRTVTSIPTQSSTGTRETEHGSVGTPASANMTAATSGTPNLQTSAVPVPVLPIVNSIESSYRLVLTSASGNYHKHVFCDSCLGEVPSNRYKCLQCANFDLCAKCESKGVHPEHLMVRVSQAFVHKHKNNLHDAFDEIYAKAAKRKK